MTDPQHHLSNALADRYVAGRYVIEQELGRGGMAVVYLAHDRKLGRAVALKVLRSELAASIGSERFLREIEIAARLTHPSKYFIDHPPWAKPPSASSDGPPGA